MHGRELAERDTAEVRREMAPNVRLVAPQRGRADGGLDMREPPGEVGRHGFGAGFEVRTRPQLVQRLGQPLLGVLAGSGRETPLLALAGYRIAADIVGHQPTDAAFADALLDTALHGA